MQHLRLIIFALLFLTAVSSMASAVDPFGAFIAGLRSACATPPAARCAAAVNGYLDRDASGRIELRELKQARRQARLTVRTKQAPLRPLERP